MIRHFYTLQRDHPRKSSNYLSPCKVVTILLTVFASICLQLSSQKYMLSITSNLDVDKPWPIYPAYTEKGTKPGQATEVQVLRYEEVNNGLIIFSFPGLHLRHYNASSFFPRF